MKQRHGGKDEEKLKHVGRIHTDNHKRLAWMFALIILLIVIAISGILIFGGIGCCQAPTTNNTDCLYAGGICADSDFCSTLGLEISNISCSKKEEYCCISPT